MLVLFFILIALFFLVMLLCRFAEPLGAVLTRILATIMLGFRKPLIGIALAAVLVGIVLWIAKLK